MTEQTNPPRQPLWSKSMQRRLDQSSGALAPAHRTDEPPALAQLDGKLLARLGLKRPPEDPRMLGAFLVAEDAVDAAMDADEFVRGIRRAVRMQWAQAAGLHRRAGLPWKAWVEQEFRVGYACFNRYHVAAQLQVGLVARGLPPLVSEHQARALAPFRRHEKFWSVFGGFGAELPAAKTLAARMPALLGLAAEDRKVTTRIRLHRLLQRIVKGTSEDEPCVGVALGHVRRAISVLEKGGAS